MDKDAKKAANKEKKQRKKARDNAIKNAADLMDNEKFEECLEYINSLGEDELRVLKIFWMKVLVLAQLQRHDEVLDLQRRQEEFGHVEKTLPYGVWFIYAESNRIKKNFFEAYQLYERVRQDKDASTDTKKECEKCIKELKEDENFSKELGRIADEKMNRFLGEELSRSSASAASSSASVAAPPPSVAAPPPAVAAPPPAVAAPPPAVAAPPPAAMKFSDDDTVRFEMEKVDERSCRGNMVIGQGLFPKSYIQIEESSEISDCLKKNPFLLKIEFCMYSRSLSRRVAVVEPVRSVRLFFESKLESFRTEAIPQSCEKWWKYIENDFRSIFRGIVGGMHALYLADEVCGDLGNSIYVTEEGDAKLFHVFEGKFTYVQAHKEVDELWSVMESVITLISPRPTPKTDLNTWMKEFRVYYKLPDELCHFLRSLRAKKLGGFIEPTWLIDHPFIWSINHRVWFIKTLEEFIKERKFNIVELNRRLHPNFGASWRPRVLIDPLLVAIYDYNGEDFYTRNACHIINYIHGIFFHANDFKYDNLRGKKGGLSVEELEMLVTKVFPDIYTILYDALHAYAENVNEAKYGSLSQVLQRCSSFAGR